MNTIHLMFTATKKEDLITLYWTDCTADTIIHHNEIHINVVLSLYWLTLTVTRTLNKIEPSLTHFSALKAPLYVKVVAFVSSLQVCCDATHV